MTSNYPTSLVSLALILSLLAGSRQSLAGQFTFVRIIDNSASYGLVGGSPTLNNSGTVAFWAASARTGEEGIFATDGTTITTIADSLGPFSNSFSVFGGSPSLNNAGGVAFWAQLNNGVQGIFTGPDPVVDKVIATGDVLDGKLVSSLQSARGPIPTGAPPLGTGAGINDGGQVVFFVHFTDGSTAIYRADPGNFAVPEPSSFTLWGLTVMVSMAYVFSCQRKGHWWGAIGNR